MSIFTQFTFTIRTHRKRLAIGGLVCFCLCVALVWIIGGTLCARTHWVASKLPRNLPGEAVEFTSYSGSKLRGWFVPGKTNHTAVVLMHGVRGNRSGMLGRARFLNAAGCAVLMFDFQAHGESEGRTITFGYLESEDARAAVDFIRNKVPGEKVIVIGSSMGGAAAVLAKPPLKVDGMVLEMVYPTITEAVSDRMAMRLGPIGRLFTPLLTLQLKPRIGCSAEDLRPIEKVRSITVPKLFIAGTEDRHTRFAEATALFEAAAQPKDFWPIQGAGHQDLHAMAKPEYEKRVLAFIDAIEGCAAQNAARR